MVPGAGERYLLSKVDSVGLLALGFCLLESLVDSCPEFRTGILGVHCALEDIVRGIYDAMVNDIPKRPCEQQELRGW